MNSVLRSIVVVGVRRSRFLIYEHLHFNVTNKPQKTQMVINTNMKSHEPGLCTLKVDFTIQYKNYLISLLIEI